MSDSFSNRPMIRQGKQSSAKSTADMALPGFAYPAFNEARAAGDLKKAQFLIQQYAASAGTSPAVVARMLGFGA